MAYAEKFPSSIRKPGLTRSRRANLTIVFINDSGLDIIYASWSPAVRPKPLSSTAEGAVNTASTIRSISPALAAQAARPLLSPSRKRATAESIAAAIIMPPGLKVAAWNTAEGTRPATQSSIFPLPASFMAEHTIRVYASRFTKRPKA